MNLKIGFMFLLYYTVLSLLFLASGSPVADSGATSNIYLNSSEMTSSEIDTGGLFGTGVSFWRFLGFVTIGIGLPGDTPIFFLLLFSAWQTIMTILAIMWIISSIWAG